MCHREGTLCAIGWVPGTTIRYLKLTNQIALHYSLRLAVKEMQCKVFATGILNIFALY